ILADNGGGLIKVRRSLTTSHPVHSLADEVSRMQSTWSLNLFLETIWVTSAHEHRGRRRP
ncbi:hypothetical protein EVAR_101050_1, partial [Eumeta japonica]